MSGRRHALIALTATVLSACVLVPAIAPGVVFEAPRDSLLEGKLAGPDHFVLAGIEEECVESSFEGAFYRRTLELAPIYGDCTAKSLGGLPAKFILYGCAFLVRGDGAPFDAGRWRARVDLTCRPTYSLRWQVYESQEKYEVGAAVCTTLMHPQRDVGSAELTNMKGHPSDITIRWRLDELEYESFGSSLFCGSPEGTVEQGGTSFTGYTTVRAADLSERRQNLAVGD